MEDLFGAGTGAGAGAGAGSGRSSEDHPAFVVVCSRVRDPGNAGTVVRSADAAGADAVFFADESVDPFNPKTVRASAGSVLHLPVIEAASTARVIDELSAKGLSCAGASPRGGTPYFEVDWTSPCAIVLGNETEGLDPSTLSVLSDKVTIPMTGRAESLNVSMAASIICFEVLRQRRVAGL